MKRQSVRVIVASEYPEVRHFLRETVEREPGTVIIGQAENAARALSLARKLRPDVAIIDSALPHTFGLDAVPLSRIGGLDTALAAAEEIPNMRVVLLSNLDTEILPGRRLSSGSVPIFSREVMGASIPFTIQELCHGAEATDTLVFAYIGTQPRASFTKKIISTIVAWVCQTGKPGKIECEQVSAAGMAAPLVKTTPIKRRDDG